MRIALYHDLPSGGAKRALFETTQRLAREHVVDVYTLNTANHDFCDIRPLVRQHRIFEFQPASLFRSPLGRLNQVQRWRTLRRLERLARHIAAEMDREGYDLVYVHPSMWIQAPMVLNYLQTPTVYHVQEPPRWAYELSIPRPYLAGRWRKRLDRVDPLISLHWQAFTMLDRRNTLAATRLLANSCFTAANVQDVYGRHAEVAYLGVDSRVFHPLSDEKKEDFVLSVGELRPNKGFDFLIAAIARVAAADRPPLRIIGNASNQQEYAYLVSLAREKGVELDIEVMVDQETLVRRYNQAALLVYAPIHEPFGLVPLEAMACGTPVVAVAEGGVKETVLHHVTGLLTPREPGAFAAAVEQLLRDPERRNQMGNSGRQQTAAHWSWDTSVRHIESCLRDAAQARRPSGDCE